MITVFYDGGCGLCNTEIKYYMKIAPKDVFDWVDLTRDPKKLTAQGYSVSAGMKLMHVMDHSGEMKIGVDAFITMWSGLGSYWKGLAILTGLPGIKWIARGLYTVFARSRRVKINL